MTDEPQKDVKQSTGDGFAKGLSSAVAKKTLAPIAASAATAGTAYLTRKAAEVWREQLSPKVQEKGGGRAVVKEALETAAGKLGGRGSKALGALADLVGDGGRTEASPESAADKSTDVQRDEERRQRQQRRRQRQRALEQTGST